MRFQLSVDATPEEWVPTLVLLRSSLDTLIGTTLTSPAAVGAETAKATPPTQWIGKPWGSPVDPVRLREGAAAFGGLVEMWARGFGEIGALQPDRVGELVDAMTQHGHDIILFVQEAGGLIPAVAAILMRPDGSAGLVDDPMFARKLAENMAQVGSIICPPLAQTLDGPTIRASMDVSTPLRNEY